MSTTKHTLETAASVLNHVANVPLEPIKCNFEPSATNGHWHTSEAEAIQQNGYIVEVLLDIRELITKEKE